MDFLGFSRQKSRIINGLRRIFGGNFFLSPVLARKPERPPAVEAFRKGGIVHGASLLQFLIVSKKYVGALAGLRFATAAIFHERTQPRQPDPAVLSY